MIRTLAWIPLLVGIAGETYGLGTGPEILQERRHRYESQYRWSDQRQVVRITSAGFDGKPQVRTLELYERRYADGRQRSLLVFQSPDRMKGTAVLSQSVRDGAGERWLYLPGLKRARRFADQVRDESVVGSDLTYREIDLMRRMLTWTERDARVAVRSDSMLGSTVTHVLELWPKATDPDQHRLLLWLAQGDLVMRQLEIYDADDVLQKRIRQSAVTFEGRVPVAARVDVEDPRSGSRSCFEVLEAAFDVGFADDVFSLAEFDTHRR
jgi:hypothetical protein